MSYCVHRHPYGESYCTACQEDKARIDEKSKVLYLINLRLSEAQSRDVRMMLLRLKEEIR